MNFSEKTRTNQYDEVTWKTINRLFTNQQMEWVFHDEPDNEYTHIKIAVEELKPQLLHHHYQRWFCCRYCDFPLFMENSIIQKISKGLILIEQAGLQADFIWWPNGNSYFLRRFYCSECMMFLSAPIPIAIPYRALASENDEDEHRLGSYFNFIDSKYVLLLESKIKMIIWF